MPILRYVCFEWPNGARYKAVHMVQFSAPGRKALCLSVQAEELSPIFWNLIKFNKFGAGAIVHWLPLMFVCLCVCARG